MSGNVAETAPRLGMVTAMRDGSTLGLATAALLLGCSSPGASTSSTSTTTTTTSVTSEAGTTPRTAGTSNDGSDTTAEPRRDVGTETPDLGEFEGCSRVMLPGPPQGSWSVDGPLGFDRPRLGDRGWSYRVPALAADTAVTFTHSDGAVVTATLRASPPPPTFAVGMVPGCGRFPYGVASGDPSSDAVHLWTRVAADGGTQGRVEVGWQLATDPDFETLVASGSAVTSADSDFTVQVVAEALSPATTYYYRFFEGELGVETTSVTGRTRTAPGGPSARLRMAVTSCTSIFSGYFNGYRAIARRLDLDALIHVGDYVYDFPDEDELIRIPDPVPANPVNLDEWRSLHAYHLADPDLRAARAAHPWIMIWDNHDLSASAPDYGGGVQAFREWNPIAPPPATAGPERAYRRLAFGELLDIFMIDVLLFRDDADAPDGPDKSILGDAQRTWLREQLSSSTATWRVLGNQKPVAPILGLLQVLGGSTWNGFPDARAQLFAALQTDGIDNVVFLSGDAHITAITDLVTAPDDPAQYDPKTGEGAIAVEFQPASMSRGNVDEFFPNQPQLPANLERDALSTDPHYRFLDTTRHGYGVLDIDARRIRAEVWYLDILERTDEEVLGAALEVQAGANHWDR